jgi:hypothetical protein
MKEYLLSVHDVAGAPTPSDEERQQMFKDVGELNEQIMAEGAWVFAGGLCPPSTATVVHSKGGQVTTTDGPYVETKEHLGGFWVIQADDLDAALEWAAKGSAACGAPVEVRPFEGEVESQQ